MIAVERGADQLFTFDLPHDLYADGIGAVQNLGVNFRTIYFVWSLGLGGVLERVPVACIVRPRSSVLRADGAITKLLARDPDPRCGGMCRN